MSSKNLQKTPPPPPPPSLHPPKYVFQKSPSLNFALSSTTSSCYHSLLSFLCLTPQIIHPTTTHCSTHIPSATIMTISYYTPTASAPPPTSSTPCSSAQESHRSSPRHIPYNGTGHAPFATRSSSLVPATALVGSSPAASEVNKGHSRQRGNSVTSTPQIASTKQQFAVGST